jgi:hypothetical protein
MTLDEARDKPMWMLTSAEIDMLDPQERQWVINNLAYMRDEGVLALVLANPKGTTYETVWADKRWSLKPVPKYDPTEAIAAIRSAIYEETGKALKLIVDEVSKISPAKTE